MLFTNKRFSVLFLSLILLACSNSAECKPKQFVKRSSSILSKFIDLNLCAITATYAGLSIHCLYSGICRHIEYINSHAGKQTNELYKYEALYRFSIASIAATILYLKSQWQSQSYIECDTE